MSSPASVRALGVALLISGCGAESGPPPARGGTTPAPLAPTVPEAPASHAFTEGRTFAGDLSVSADALNAGHDAYRRRCASCHGEHGDGRGPAAKGLTAAPPDFSLAIFKYARQQTRDDLPPDEDLARIIRGGLRGTAMAPQAIGERELGSIVAYMKTFAPERWEKRKQNGAPVRTIAPFQPGADPWAGKEAEAVARGKELYHLRLECMYCHPAYDVRRDLQQLSVTAAAREPDMFKPMSGFRAGVHAPVEKESEYRETIRPQDFLVDVMPSIANDSKGASTVDLYRVVTFGVYPIMPGWGTLIAEKEKWAVAHYVKFIADLRGTSRGAELRHKLDADTDALATPP